MKGNLPEQLRAYWLGKGLARWAGSPKPWTTLNAALRSEGVPARMVDGLTTELYREHFGHNPPHGDSKHSSTAKLAARLSK